MGGLGSRSWRPDRAQRGPCKITESEIFSALRNLRLSTSFLIYHLHWAWLWWKVVSCLAELFQWIVSTSSPSFGAARKKVLDLSVDGWNLSHLTPDSIDILSVWACFQSSFALFLDRPPRIQPTRSAPPSAITYSTWYSRFVIVKIVAPWSVTWNQFAEELGRVKKQAKGMGTRCSSNPHSSVPDMECIQCKLVNLV